MSPRSVKLGILFLILFIVVIISSKITSGPFKDLPPIRLSSTFHFEFRSETLSKIIQKNLWEKGDYAIYIEDLSDHEIFTLRSNDEFPAASLYKVYLIASVLKEIEDGNLSLEDKISASKDYLKNRLGGDDFGYDDVPDQIEYSVEEALERVGRISDNYAAIMLTDKIGVEKLKNMTESLEATSTEFEDPTTTASDIATFFKKLYLKQIISENVSNEIDKILSLNQLNDRIPQGILISNENRIPEIPDGVKIIHKTGELPGVRHDAGIVYLPNGKAYIIVLMSQNLEYEDDGVETLANISNDVYEYFNSKYKD